MRYFILSILLLFCLRLTGQIEVFQGNTKEYYFPYSSMFTPVTYTFQNIADSSDRFIWELQTNVFIGDTFLNIRVYDGKKNLSEESMNRITNSEVLLTKFSLYKNLDDTIRKYNCIIHDSIEYSFKQSNDTIVKWEAELFEPRFKTSVILSKTHELLGYEPHSGTLKYCDRYVTSVAGKEYPSHTVYTYFAKSKGVCKYTILDGEGITKVYFMSNP